MKIVKKKNKVMYKLQKHWINYFLSKCNPTGINGTLEVSNVDVKEWKRISNTKFKDLPEKEKKVINMLAKKYLK
jgi:hypothetical protein